MPSGRAGITGMPSVISAGTCTKSWKATGFAMRGSSRTSSPAICQGVAVTRGPAGRGGAHLVGAVPSRRGYRLADVPCALSWEQVRRLLGMAGVREPNGRRNYAMLLLIASYGLRGCEARALRLNDIDRAHDETGIFAPKTGRRRALPLTRPAGGGGAGLPAGRTPPVAASGSLPVQPPAAWPATEQDQPLAGTPAGQGGHRDRPPRCSYPAPLAGGPPAAQR